MCLQLAMHANEQPHEVEQIQSVFCKSVIQLHSGRIST